MKSKVIKSICWLFVFIVISHGLFSMDIKGTIIDQNTKVPLSLVNIRSTSSPNLYTISGLNGEFKIKSDKLPIELSFSLVGYKTIQITLSNASANIIELEPYAAELNEVIVRASIDKNNDVAARNIEKYSTSIANVVSAKTIEQSPDITVANVIQRISGITLERTSNGDAQYATLRGMDKRYNFTLVNGLKIPSPDNKNRFVPLDIFPADMLARLEVIKSPTSDMEGDGIGGAINMVMKDAPNLTTFSINLSSGYNDLFFSRDFQSYNHQAIDLKSPYELNTNLYAARFRDFSDDLTKISYAKPLPNLFLNSFLGGRLFKSKLGYMVGVSFQNSNRGNNNTIYGSNISTSDASNLPVLTGKTTRLFSDQQSRLGLHSKLDYYFSEQHKIQWYTAYLDFSNYQIRDSKGIDYSIGYDPGRGNYNVSYGTRFRYTHQNILHSALMGEDSFFEDRFKLDYSLAYALATNETPENTTVHTVSTVRNNVENQISVVTLGGADIRWEHNSDEDLTAKINFSTQFALNDATIDLLAGGLYRVKNRSNFFNEYNLRPFDDRKPIGQKNNLIKGVDWNDYSEILYSVYNPFGAIGDPLNYDASEKIQAGYVQGKLSAEHYQLNAGLRVENTDQGYQLINPIANVKNVGNQVYTDLLPSFHFKYIFKEGKQMRISYTKAINRPSFFEIVPYKIVNEEFTEMGNPELKHTVADNFDLRYELYPSPSEQFLIGAFYKNINDPIEMGIIDQGQGSFLVPSNFGVAKNYGLEIDATKYFYNFGVKMNYTFTNSAITTSKVYYELNSDPSSSVKNVLKTGTQTRQLNGQAAHLANFTLLYKNIKQNVDVQLSANYTGDKLFAISRFLDNDTWQKGFIQLDLSLEKKIKKFTFYIKSSNLLNTPIELYLKKSNKNNQTLLENFSYPAGTLLRSDINGIAFQIGLKYKL